MNRSSLAAALLACACQTYDFQPTEPLTVAQTTAHVEKIAHSSLNLMLVVDKSGSMNDKLDPSCTSNCPTRIGDLKAAMATFLAQNPAGGRLGLTTFPNADSGCGTGGTRVLELPTAAGAVNSSIQSIVAGGGTPTALAL